MADDHLTLRLPTQLARALTRWAATHDIPKSRVVREAITRYLGAPAGTDPSTVGLTARALGRRWATLPRLDPDEAARFDEDLSEGRAEVPPLAPPWE